MSTKNKLLRFAENLELPNVFENYSFHDPVLYKSLHEKIDYKGNWNSGYFNNNYPITLELACGGGEYCLGLSAIFPEKNFIGIDIKGARIWKGAKIAFNEKISRIAFIRTKIELISHFFEKDEVSEIWITFPDPFLKYSKSSKRLSSPHYLEIYKNVLRPGALLHLKTDDDALFKFTLEVIEKSKDYKIIYSNGDIYKTDLAYPELELKTYYENKHLTDAKKIKYIRFQYNSEK